MKRAIDFVSEWAQRSSDDPMRDYVELLHEYGEQVREECAKIAENTSRLDFDKLSGGRTDLANEIRDLELP